MFQRGVASCRHPPFHPRVVSDGDSADGVTRVSTAASGLDGQQHDHKTLGKDSKVRADCSSPKNRRPATVGVSGSESGSAQMEQRDKSGDGSCKSAAPNRNAGDGGRDKGRGQSRPPRSLNRTGNKQLPPPPTTAENSPSALGETEAELSIDARAPGVIKLFGESVVEGAQYKAVLASTRSTSVELVKQALERYGLPSDTYYQYVLCDTVGIVNRAEDIDDSIDNEARANKEANYSNADTSSDLSSLSISAGDLSDDSSFSGSFIGPCASKGLRTWTPVSTRVLDDADRPLELQMYWKPPKGLNRRFELHRRDSLVRESCVDDTSGLNSNARRIMMSKVPSGAIPPSPCSAVILSAESKKRQEEKRPKAGLQGNGVVQPLRISGADSSVLKSSPDSEVRQAFVCPSIYPYLLTLRGFDMQKDQILYPLKSKTLVLGRKHRRSHADDINLLADDVLDRHCCVHLKTMSEDAIAGFSEDKRRYWYCLEVDAFDEAEVFVNGQRVEQGATVLPGDLLGVGHHYVFLYKDPTGGHDIPGTLAWYPGQINKEIKINLTQKEEQNFGVESQEELSQKEAGGSGRRGLNVPYPWDKERDVLEYIVNISCSSPSDFPLATAVLLLGCHAYSSSRFSASHQAEFFQRLLKIIQNCVSVVCKKLSLQKYQSNLYQPLKDRDKIMDDNYDGDPLLELLCWLSNAVCLYNHFTSADFLMRTPQAQSSDVMESRQGLCDGLEEMISVMFQQSVYSITKVLFAPVEQILHPPGSPSAPTDNARALAGMERVLHVLRMTFHICQDLSLHRDVISQLLTYLLFFVTTTLFNKLMGPGTKHFCWSVGVRLQACISSLEEWVNSLGMEAQYLQVSERLLTLVDLLATSRHTLLRMDWPSFRKQYSPLSEAQLLKVLIEYQFSDGQAPPASWLPPPGVMASEDVTISLSSHPSFLLPRHGPGVDLEEAFPPPLHVHLNAVIRRFSSDLEGVQTEDVLHNKDSSEQSSDLSLSSSRSNALHGLFFTWETCITNCNYRPSIRSPPLQSQQQPVNGRSREISPPRPQRHRPDECSSPPPKLPPRRSSVHFQPQPIQQTVSAEQASGVLPENRTFKPRRSSSDCAAVINAIMKSDQDVKPPEYSMESKRDLKQDQYVQHEALVHRSLSPARCPRYSVQQSNATCRKFRAFRGPLDSCAFSSLVHSSPSLMCHQREPPPYHKVSRHLLPAGRNVHQKQHQAQKITFLPNPSLAPSAADLNRPLNGMDVSIEPFTLKDKRIMNVSPFQISSENSLDSTVSDNLFIRSNSELQTSEFRRFSTGMLSREKTATSLDTHHECHAAEKCPDDIYIDVMNEVESNSRVRLLKVLPHEDSDGRPSIKNQCDHRQVTKPIEPPKVQYRHKLLQERKCFSKSEIMGEVFTVTLQKDSHLGMGLIDGMMPGIYIRNILPGTPAALCGHIRVGDRILAVNGHSIVGASCDSVMKLISSTGPWLNLLITKCDCSEMAHISCLSVDVVSQS